MTKFLSTTKTYVNDLGHYDLVGALEHFSFFHIYLEYIIIPTDELTPSFFRGVAGPTTNQWAVAPNPSDFVIIFLW
jgi:hypothetical protein